MDHLFARAIEGLEYFGQKLILLYPVPKPHVVTYSTYNSTATPNLRSSTQADVELRAAIAWRNRHRWDQKRAAIPQPHVYTKPLLSAAIV
jgi:hypothetical protein